MYINTLDVGTTDFGISFDGRRWDEQIEQDSRACRLDKLADAAMRAAREGKTETVTIEQLQAVLDADD